MPKLRDPNKDPLKSGSVLKAQILNNIMCKLIDCNEPVSIFEGPGSNCLCRKHQLQAIEYGGMGRIDRPHTFYRNWVCDSCGYDVREDPLILAIEDPFEQLQAMRMVMQGDHIIRKSDGGTDSEENINPLCCRCHMIKTAREKDSRKGNLLICD